MGSLLRFALVATVLSYSMAALQCYSGNSGSAIDTRECHDGIFYCVKRILIGYDGNSYSCDDAQTGCSSIGHRCKHDGGESQDSPGAGICCCNSDLCNAATMKTQHFVLGIVSLILSAMCIPFLFDVDTMSMF
jgi:hypothetical protein